MHFLTKSTIYYMGLGGRPRTLLEIIKIKNKKDAISAPHWTSQA